MNHTVRSSGVAQNHSYQAGHFKDLEITSQSQRQKLELSLDKTKFSIVIL